jgi:hypothetical protein
MPQKHFKLSTIAPVDPEFAFRFLSNLNNHRYLHPYFVSAEPIRSGIDSTGYSFQDFIVTERPRFAGFHYTITFPTRLMVTGKHEFTTEVHAALNTRLVNVTRCEGEQNNTRITESVTISAPWLTIHYVEQQAFIAHRKSFELLPTVLRTRAKQEVQDVTG